MQANRDEKQESPRVISGDLLIYGVDVYEGVNVFVGVGVRVDV